MRLFTQAPAVILVAILSMGSLQAAPSYEGTWKVTVKAGAQDLDVWLFKVEVKDGKPSATFLSAGLPQFDKTGITVVSADEKGVALEMAVPRFRTFTLKAYLPKDQKEPKHLKGILMTGNLADFLEMNKSDEKKLDPAKASRTIPEAKVLREALGKEDEKAQVKAINDLIDQGKLPAPLTYQVGLQLVRRLARDPANKDTIAKRLEQIVKSVAPYGPDFEIRALGGAASAMASSEKLAPLAVDYAQRARKKLADSKQPNTLKANLLKTLATALKTSGKADEAKAVEADLAKLDAELDKDFAKTNIPFEIKPFDGRKAKSNRVAVVELFTGAQCPPCVAADVAFDAMLKTYKNSDVVLLQYHNHIPGPDPLTSKDAADRHQFYKDRLYTPALMVNGEEVQPIGGGRSSGEARYKSIREKVEKSLEAEAEGKIDLSAETKDGAIEITAKVSDLKKTGEKIRLRFVLIEDLVRYAGRNGQRLHHHVVRALPGGVKGTELKEKSTTKTVSIKLADLRKELNSYLDEYAKTRPFPDSSRPLELKDLKVVALIQDDETKAVLTAAQVDLK